MVFAFASSAFANWGGWTGNTATWNEAATSSAGNPYDSSAAGGAPRHSTSYVNWDNVMDAGTENTPHKGYTDSSTLCAVCHSVHYAPVFENQSGTSAAWGVPNSSETTVGGYNANAAPVGTPTYNSAYNGYAAGSPVQAEMLLRTGVGTACNYCHINSSIGVKEVYAGQADIFGYSQNFTSSYAHNWHDAGCSDCHAVHGANTYNGVLSEKILNRMPRNRNPQREVIAAQTTSNSNVPALYATLADAYAETTDRDKQTSAFCSSCHYVYSNASENAVKERGGTAGFTKHHPMKAAEAGSASTAMGASDYAETQQWAWVGSETCRSCHKAGNVDETPGLTGYSTANFPHYTKDKYRFLEQDFAGEHLTDQVCIDCHRDAGTGGVGNNF
jgi:nitrate/TMAO reductase-like tetraheme cytochrome c subunit